jgi:hypothetical protein
MAEISELIEAVHLEDGSCNRWVPALVGYKAVAVRYSDGKMFLQVKSDKIIWVELSRDEMLAIGVACIQTANDRGADDES